MLAAAAAVTVAEFPFSPPTNNPVSRPEKVVVAEDGAGYGNRTRLARVKA